MQKHELIELIHKAFKNARRPKDDNLPINARGEYFAPLRVEDWRTISYESIIECQEAIEFHTNPQWLIFLLPAFLTRVLENREDGRAIEDTIVICLTPPALRRHITLEGEEKFLKFINLLGKEEYYVFYEFLQFVAKDQLADIVDDSSILWAIRYWGYKSVFPS